VNYTHKASHPEEVIPVFIVPTERQGNLSAPAVQVKNSQVLRLKEHPGSQASQIKISPLSGMLNETVGPQR
jgi:hypothetical protein